MDHDAGSASAQVDETLDGRSLTDDLGGNGYTFNV